MDFSIHLFYQPSCSKVKINQRFPEVNPKVIKLRFSGYGQFIKKLNQRTNKLSERNVHECAVRGEANSRLQCTYVVSFSHVF